VAAVTLLGSLALLPITRYVPGGHEGAYLSLAAGLTVDPGAEGRFATMPVGVSVATFLGLVGGRGGELVWLLLNRLAVPVAVLAAAGVGQAGAPGPPRGRPAQAAATVAAVLVAACTPLHAWAGTGFFVGPATAFAALALWLGARGKPSAALGWGALAAGSRLETLPLALVAVFIGVLLSRLARRPRGHRPSFGMIAVAGATAVLVGVDLAGRGAPPTEGSIPGPDVLMAGFASLPLAGPLASPLVAGLGMVLLALAVFAPPGARLDPQRRRGPLLLVGLALAAIAAIVPVLGLVDLGSRHALPACLALSMLGGIATGQAHRARAGRFASTAVASAASILFALQVLPMRTHHAAGDAAPSDSWTRLDPTLPDRPLLRCRLLQEGAAGGPGIGPFSGAELLEAHRALRAGDLGPGGCLVVDAPDAHVIRGDARADRLDRARVLLDLRPTMYDDRILWFRTE
jgi:hypothetical protein